VGLGCKPIRRGVARSLAGQYPLVDCGGLETVVGMAYPPMFLLLVSPCDEGLDAACAAGHVPRPRGYPVPMSSETPGEGGCLDGLVGESVGQHVGDGTD
jgi:hypothetical protein